MKKLLNIQELSEQTGRPVRQLRTLVQARKIPCYRLGYRTLWFDLAKVDAAWARYEVKEVGAK